MPVGSPGTIPLGLKSVLNPPGSCSAHPNGPIQDGQQLVDITQNPGNTDGNVDTPPPSGGEDPNKPTSTSTPPMNTDVPPMNTNTPPAVDPPASMPTQSVPNSQGGDFRLQNGKDAQKLNAQFATLTPDSSCTGKIITFPDR